MSNNSFSHLSSSCYCKKRIIPLAGPVLSSGDSDLRSMGWGQVTASSEKGLCMCICSGCLCSESYTIHIGGLGRPRCPVREVGSLWDTKKPWAQWIGKWESFPWVLKLYAFKYLACKPKPVCWTNSALLDSIGLKYDLCEDGICLTHRATKIPLPFHKQKLRRSFDKAAEFEHRSARL